MKLKVRFILLLKELVDLLADKHSALVQKKILEMAERQEVLSDKRKSAYSDYDKDVIESTRLAQELEEKLRELAGDKFADTLIEVQKEEAELLSIHHMLLKGA